MNLHLKTGLGNKNYVLDPNSDVENDFLTDFLWQFWAKNTKINFSSESVKTREHTESNSCDKYHFSINAFYKINLWPILKKLLQKVDFRHFPLEIFAPWTILASVELVSCPTRWNLYFTTEMTKKSSTLAWGSPWSCRAATRRRSGRQRLIAGSAHQRCPIS